MNPPSHGSLEARARPASLLRECWRGIEHDASWFVLASFLDAAVTWLLLTQGSHGGSEFFERNRIAAYFLHHWGLKGLFAFKLVMVALVCLICLAVSLRRPETARQVLRLGTVVVIAVVFYSVWLFVQ